MTNSIHDMGGMHGFGPVEEEPDEPVFHETWESRVYAMNRAMGPLRLPAIEGILTSLVGPDPTFDHDFVHRLGAGSRYTQHLHVDAIVDSRHPAFDVQLFYFPHAIAPGRHAWLQVARGALRLGDDALEAGDGASVSEEGGLDVEASRDAELLLFDLA